MYQLHVPTSKLPISAVRQFLPLNTVFRIWSGAYLAEVETDIQKSQRDIKAETWKPEEEAGMRDLPEAGSIFLNL